MNTVWPSSSGDESTLEYIRVIIGSRIDLQCHDGVQPWGSWGWWSGSVDVRDWGLEGHHRSKTSFKYWMLGNENRASRTYQQSLTKHVVNLHQWHSWKWAGGGGWHREHLCLSPSSWFSATKKRESQFQRPPPVEWWPRVCQSSLRSGHLQSRKVAWKYWTWQSPLLLQSHQVAKSLWPSGDFNCLTCSWVCTAEGLWYVYTCYVLTHWFMWGLSAVHLQIISGSSADYPTNWKP